MSNYAAKLENWMFHMITNKEGVMFRDCYGDTKGRFEDGDFIKTSGVKAKAFKEGDIIKTRNSTYLLGKPYDA